MSYNHSDYSGQKFNSWTVVCFYEKRDECNYWLCCCDCGAESLQLIYTLRSGKSKACYSCAKKVHGLTAGRKATPEYKCWDQLKQRCFNPNHISYPNYGGSGVRICEFILANPTSLISLIGKRPDKALSLDRIDTNGNYSCGNCNECRRNGWQLNLRWATKLVQSQNRRNVVFATINGVSMPLSDIARETGLCLSSIHKRVQKGQMGEELLLPHQYRKPKKK